MNFEPNIDTDVDIDELFTYDETKSPEENYADWLSHIYDTFAGIASGDNYLEIIEAFANEKIVSIKTERTSFKDVKGLPSAIRELICEVPRKAEDLLHNKAILGITGGAEYRLDSPLKMKLMLKSYNAYASEVLISKQGEEHDEPVNITCNDTKIGTMSSNELLTLLISLNDFNDEAGISTEELSQLSPTERDIVFMRLLRQLGYKNGVTVEDDKLYGPLTYANNDSQFANGVIAVNQVETPKESIVTIEIVKHDLFTDLDSEIIYRLSAEIYNGASGIITNGEQPHAAQIAQKIVHSPASFHVRKIVANMEFDGKKTAMELNKTNMVMMIKVVQDLVSNIVDRIDTPSRG